MRALTNRLAAAARIAGGKVRRRVASKPAIAAAVAAPSRPWRSNSSRSKLELTWISIDGAAVALDRADRIVAGADSARCRMSLTLVATISLPIGSPIRAAT